ncbi:MAG: hypothetical protein KME49_22720 [Brasilonema octagenarum HA4186-MV1]|nr:hypothetical protein [Brasilonema octagenarum HA4186-MV1]
MQSIYCYRCDDYTPHQPLANGNSICSQCGRERESALTRKMLEKTPLSEHSRYVVLVDTENGRFYLKNQNEWTRVKSEAKQYQSKRSALEIMETGYRPSNDFYPKILHIDEYDKDFVVDSDDEDNQNISAILNLLESELPSPQVSRNLLDNPNIWKNMQPPDL